MPKDLTSFLGQRQVFASAPLRIDCGGTWDLVPLALPYRIFDPITVNFALSARVVVRVRAYRKGAVRVESAGFNYEEGVPSKASFSSPLGRIFFLCHMFDVAGADIAIRSDIDPGSGLGGSAAVLVATVAALDYVEPLFGRRMRRAEIAHLANRVESSLHSCGFQDHLVATWGGANAWYWQYHDRSKPYVRRTLLRKKTDLNELSDCILIAHTGETRHSSSTADDWVQRFLSGDEREMWVKSNILTNRFAEAIVRKDWGRAASCLKKEAGVRTMICEGAMTPRMRTFADIAGTLGCSARYAGGGGGGCIWAFGSGPEHIDRLKSAWDTLVRSTSEAKILDYRLSEAGVVVWSE